MFPPPLPAAARRATAADRAPAAAPPRLRVGAGAEGPDRTGPDRTEPNRPGEGARRSLWVSPGKGSGYVPVLSQNDWLTPPPCGVTGAGVSVAGNRPSVVPWGGGFGEGRGRVLAPSPAGSRSWAPPPHTHQQPRWFWVSPALSPSFPSPFAPQQLPPHHQPRCSRPFFPKHLPGTSLVCPPPNLLPAALSPRAVLVALTGSHPTVATGPFFYFSVLWDLCSGGNACCCPCPFPRRQRSQETLQAPPHLWPRSRGRPSTSVFPIVSVKWG